MNREDAKTCVEPGWGKLIDWIYDTLPADVHVFQVKEKFGGLRVYVGAAPDDVYEFISAIEMASYTICEQCGQPGRLRSGDWIKTLCDICDAARS